MLVAPTLFAVAFELNRPASTEPVTGPDGARLGCSVAELSIVEVGGRQLGMMIRGRSTDTSVLLLPGRTGDSSGGLLAGYGLATLVRAVSVGYLERCPPGPGPSIWPQSRSRLLGLSRAPPPLSAPDRRM